MQKTVNRVVSTLLRQQWSRVVTLVLLFFLIHLWLFFLASLLNSSNSGKPKMYDVLAVDPMTTFLNLEDSDDNRFSGTQQTNSDIYPLPKNYLSYWGEVPKLDIVYTWVNGSDPRQIQGQNLFYFLFPSIALL
jgi:hypothetical protein